MFASETCEKAAGLPTRKATAKQKIDANGLRARNFMDSYP
jgi:hypothetical protein